MLIRCVATAGAGFFFLHHVATPQLYTLSLHDALPIYTRRSWDTKSGSCRPTAGASRDWWRDRKSTRLNSSHRCTSYAVFCLKKERKNKDRVATERPCERLTDSIENNRERATGATAAAA